MEFRGTVELHGKTATGIEVPAAVVESLGAGKRPAVSVTLSGHTYRTSIASMGGRFLIPVSAEIRAAAGVAAGDALDVRVELDNAPRTVEVPDDLAAALAAAPGAKKAFDAMAYSHQLRWALAVRDAKQPQTRAKRVTDAVTAMSERAR
ncbi:MAG: YdeI/OmpD-associated family protein [Actinomycetota bacterium]|nr:YdeI/OmpD-associated family protein [Actinomycetota bacterium]